MSNLTSASFFAQTSQKYQSDLYIHMVFIQKMPYKILSNKITFVLCLSIFFFPVCLSFGLSSWFNCKSSSWACKSHHIDIIQWNYKCNQISYTVTDAKSHHFILIFMLYKGIICIVKFHKYLQMSNLTYSFCFAQTSQVSDRFTYMYCFHIKNTILKNVTHNHLCLVFVHLLLSVHPLFWSSLMINWMNVAKYCLGNW